jgi:hypothetical protein
VVRSLVAALVLVLTAGCGDETPGGESQQLLVNPDFEDLAEGWVVVGNVLIEGSRENVFEAPSGELAALVGGDEFVDSALVQVVDLPADATGIRLRGLHCVITYDVNAEEARDFCDVSGEIAGDTTLLFRTSNLDRSNPRLCQWEPFEISAPVEPGATINLSLMSVDSIMCLYDALELTATGI